MVQSPMPSPNVVVIMADQLKASALGIYGNRACPTPNLERLAAEGVAFDAAVTPHPLCVPARVAFWTSRYPHQTGCRRNETLMPPGTRHAFRIWKERGYACALIGKNHCFQQDDYEELFDTWLELGHAGVVDGDRQKGEWSVDLDELRRVHREASERLTGPDRHLKSYAPDCTPLGHTTGVVAAQACDYIASRGSQPFALWLSLPAPHEPYIVPRSYYDRIDPEAIEIPDFDEEELAAAPRRTRFLYRMLNAKGREQALRESVRTYLANALFIDEAVGEIVDAIEQAGLRENTIVVFCADHGDFSGEHNMMVKGGCFYDCLTRVPLVVSWPGQIPAGIREPSPVNLVDVVPTIFSLADGEVPREMAGTPLPGCTGTPPRDAAFSEYGAGMELLPPEVEEETFAAHEGVDALLATLRWREAEGRRAMVRTERWKYTYDPMDPVDELYDLVADPGERRNLAALEEYADVVSRLRGRLLDWSLETQDPVPVSHPAAELRHP